MVAAAVVGSAVVSAAASSYSGGKAADAQANAAKKSGQTELEMFYQNRADFAPYREVGSKALNELASLYGVAQEKPPELTFEEFIDSHYYSPSKRLAAEDYDQYMRDRQKIPDYSQKSFEGFYDSPDYKFAYDQGMRAVEQSLARRGLGGPESSGAAMKELARFGSGLASQQFGNYKNTLSAMAGIGQTATSQLGAMGQQVAANVGAGQRAAGDARASSYLNQGQAVSNIADSYAQYSLLQAGGYLG